MAKCEEELPVAKSPAGAGTYVRIPPVDNYVSTSNGATTFHTFHPTPPHSRSSNSDKNSSKFLLFGILKGFVYFCHKAKRAGKVGGKFKIVALEKADNQSSVSKINQTVTQMPSKGQIRKVCYLDSKVIS